MKLQKRCLRYETHTLMNVLYAKVSLVFDFSKFLNTVKHVKSAHDKT